jgi:oligopeptide transport system substrate-binding protein
MLADPAYNNQLYITSTSSQSWCWAFNVRETSGEYANPDFRTAALNTNFRKAVFHAFNRVPYLKTYNPEDEAVDKMLSGAFMPVGLCVTEEGKDYTEFGNLPAVIEANRNNYDPVKAKEALDAAKAELGDNVTWPIKIRILGTSSETSKARSAIIKQVLEEGLGTDNVIVETVIYTGDSYYTTVDNGAFDMWQFGWSADYADPNNYLGTLLKDNDMNDYGFEFFPSYSEYEAAYNDANTTYDIDERYEKFAKAEEIMYVNNVIIPFQYIGGNYAISKLQNPYDSLSRGMYGNSPDRLLDQIYGTEPITSEEREAQRVAYEAEKEAAKGK